MQERTSPIDTATKRRLAFGFLSNWIGRLSSSLITFVQLHVFWRYWGGELMGEWTLLNAIPAYLAFSNIGFGSVAGNDMTLRESAGDREGALAVFQSCWWLITIICAVVAMLLGPTVYWLPLDHLLRLQTISTTDARWIIFYLGLSVLLGQLEQLLGAAYTCVGRYPLGSFLKNMVALAAFSAMVATIVLGKTPRTTALVFAASNMLGTVFLAVMTRVQIPWLRFGWSHASFGEIRRMARPAIAFMAFPMGVALNLQGTAFAVNAALGPYALAVFSTARTVSRVVLQLVQMVNFTVWPELSIAFGAGNTGLVRTLHRRSCQIALIIAAVATIATLTMGPWFLHYLTHGQLPPSKNLLAILLLGVVFYSLWSTSSTLVAATNQHQKLSVYYIVGTGVTVIFTYFLTRVWGLYGAAASLILAELIMNTYVVPNSLRLTDDTWSGFLGSMLSVPAQLHPNAWLRRAAKPAPDLES